MTENEAYALGFNRIEFLTAVNIAQAYGGLRSPSVPLLQQMLNIDYQGATRIRYLIEIVIGRREVNIADLRDIDDIKRIAKHFRKINPGMRQLGITMLSPTRVTYIPKLAVIGGIKDPDFQVFNSRSASNIDDYYLLERTGQEESMLRVKKKAKTSKKEDADKIISIHGIDMHGATLLEVKNHNMRVCNRYAIIASIRQPMNHNGMYAMVTMSGDIVYIYAKTIDGNRKLNRNYAERVYDFGVIPCDLNKKLEAVAREAYSGLGCMCAKYIEPVEGFELFMQVHMQDSALI